MQSRAGLLYTGSSILPAWRRSKKRTLRQGLLLAGLVRLSLQYGGLFGWVGAAHGGAIVVSASARPAIRGLVASAAIPNTMPERVRTGAAASVRVRTVLSGRRGGRGRLGPQAQVVLRPLALGPPCLQGSSTFLLLLLAPGKGTPHSLPRA